MPESSSWTSAARLRAHVIANMSSTRELPPTSIPVVTGWKEMIEEDLCLHFHQHPKQV